MKDPRFEEDYLWSEMSQTGEDGQTVPLAINLATSIFKLLFKPGYTIRDLDQTQ